MTAVDVAPARTRSAEREKVTMAQALNRALGDAMADDGSVLVFGEDVGPLGGVFRITDLCSTRTVPGRAAAR